MLNLPTWRILKPATPASESCFEAENRLKNSKNSLSIGLRFQGARSGSVEQAGPDRFERVSASKPLSTAKRLEHQTFYNPQMATYILSVDYDGTLSTDLKGAIAFQNLQLQNLQKAGLLHLNTGRSVEDLASESHRFKSLRIYAISTSNGESLFINQDCLPGDEFIESIATRHQVPGALQNADWLEPLQAETGWQHHRAVAVVCSFIAKGLAKAGYGSLECRTDSGAVVDEILKTLHNQNMQAEYQQEGPDLYKFGPKGRAKDSPVRWLARQCPRLQQVVVAGDGLNDYPLMTLSRLPNAALEAVPVTRFLMTHDQNFVSHVLRQAPEKESIRLVHSGQSRLFESITHQLAHLETSKMPATLAEGSLIAIEKKSKKPKAKCALNKQELEALFKAL